MTTICVDAVIQSGDEAGVEESLYILDREWHQSTTKRGRLNGVPVNVLVSFYSTGTSSETISSSMMSKLSSGSSS